MTKVFTHQNTSVHVQINGSISNPQVSHCPVNQVHSLGLCQVLADTVDYYSSQGVIKF